MIKTISINLGGRVFQVNEDAYEELSNYLNHLKAFYKDTEGKDEIIHDIESRFAEIFADNVLSKGRTVVAKHDVMEVIDVMGKPEQFDEADDNSQTTKNTESSHRNTNVPRRFYRDMENAQVAGVCGGISYYFGINDPVWVRLLFILLTLVGLSTLWLYIILWIAVPEAKTTTQKLEMKGEPINLENLEKNVKEEFNRVGKNISNIANNNNTSNALSKIVSIIASIFYGFLKVIYWIGKILFYFIIGVLVCALFAALLTLVFGGYPLGSELANHLFCNTSLGIIGLVGATIFIIGLILLFSLILIKAVSKKIELSRGILYSIFASLFIGLILSLVGVSSVFQCFKKEGKDAKYIDVAIPQTDTLTLQMRDDLFEKDIEVNILGSDIFDYEEGKGLKGGRISLNIVPSSDGNFSINAIASAKGNTINEAQQTAKAIKYHVETDLNTLTFDNFLHTGNIKKWREQTLTLNLSVPEGKVIVLGKNINQILQDDLLFNYDLEEAFAYDINAYEATAWKMVNGKLIPLDTLVRFRHNDDGENIIGMTMLPYQGYENIIFNGPFDVTVRPGSEDRVYVSDWAKDLIKYDFGKYDLGFYLQQNGDTLKGPHSRPKIIIYAPRIERIEANSTASVFVRGYGTGDLEVVGNGNSIFNVDINAELMDIDLSGASEIKLKGSAEKLVLSLQGASIFKGFSFDVDDADVDIEGASNAKIYVNDKIIGNVNGASHLDIKGDPDRDLESSNSSSITDYEE